MQEILYTDTLNRLVLVWLLQPLQDVQTYAATVYTADKECVVWTGEIEAEACMYHLKFQLEHECGKVGAFNADLGDYFLKLELDGQTYATVYFKIVSSAN